MHATRPAISLRLLMPITAIALLTALLLPDQAHAQNAPTIEGPATLSFHENILPDTVLGTYTAIDSDADIDTLMWSLEGDDKDYFVIDAGSQNLGDSALLMFVSSPDFETPTDTNRGNDYNVILKVTDDGGESGTLPVTITVTNVNEAPVLGFVDDTLSVPENTPASDPIATYTAIDPDEGAVLMWTVGGTDATHF